MKSKSTFVLLVLFVGISGIAYAARNEAPVVDLNRVEQSEANLGLEVDQDEANSARARINNNHQNEPIDQRVLRLERQIANVTEMNFASKLEKMQQQMQQLQGQLEVQNHDLSQLKEQVKNFYQDLDQRVSKLSPDNTIKKEKIPLSAENKTPTEESDASNNSTPGDSKTKELQSYEAAFNLLNKENYDKAITNFQTFVKEYPESTYTANAHYWLGEIYYLKGKRDLANKEFQIIINNYPDNAKVADAMLKVGLIAMEAGNYSKAKQQFTKVQKQFPGTTTANIAALRLKEIKQKQ